MSGARWILAVLAVFLEDVGRFSATAWKEPRKFLIASDAATGGIFYVAVPKENEWTNEQMLPLTLPGQFQHPQGLAVDQRRHRLLVADPALKKVVAVQLYSQGKKLKAGKVQTVADNIEARWVALDGIGNVYLTDEADSSIHKVGYDASDAKAQVLWAGGEVSAPGGIATDNFDVFWTNKKDGDKVGVVASAPTIAGASGGAAMRSLSKAADKSYGLCMAMDEVYFTGANESMYGVKRDGGKTVQVANTFTQPRGCVWDGDGTIYVADRGANKIFAMQAPQMKLDTVRVKAVVALNEAFGVAIYSGCVGKGSHLLLSLLLILTTLSTWTTV